MLQLVNEGQFAAVALELNSASHFRGFDSDHSHCQPLREPGGREGKSECAGRRFLPVVKDAAGGTRLQMLPCLTWGVLPFACKFSPCAVTHEEAGKVLLAKDFQANYASLTTFGHFMGAQQFISRGTSACESATLCLLASEYASFQRQIMILVTQGLLARREMPILGAWKKKTGRLSLSYMAHSTFPSE